MFGAWCGRFWLHCLSQTLMATRPYAGVIDCLKTLKAEGAKLGICTKKPTGAAHDICQKPRLKKYFCVITRAYAGYPKTPGPLPLQNYVKELGADGAVYVGDSAIDYETAKNARVLFHFFTGGHQNAPLPDIRDHHRFDRWAEH